jgi:gliding motility-associated-like protein
MRITGTSGNSFTTPTLTDTTAYFVSIRNGTCESIRIPVTAFIVNAPAPPVAINNSSCGVNSIVTLTATGGSNGDYRWYEVATGGTALSGEVNDTFITPPLSATTTYYVALDNGSCESPRTAVTATINPIPSQPLITSSIAPVGNALTICGSTNLTLSAPSGYAAYLWSNGSTSPIITVSVSETYYVTVTDTTGCVSPASESLSVTVLPEPCNNEAPAIAAVALSTIIEGQVTVNLIPFITDVDDNLDLSSLTITQPPGSGALATITNGILHINYAGVNFSGTDQLTIQVCDVFSACATQVLEVEVIGDIEIYNGLSPGSDGKNDIFLIQYIDILPDTENNRVTIYNRWGSKVFEVDKYNNTTNVFRGLNNNGNELPAGTYFYKIEFENRDTITGYLSIKR